MRDGPPSGYRRVTLQGDRPTPGEAVMRLRQLLERDGIRPDDVWSVESDRGSYTAQADIPDVEREHVHAWARDPSGRWWCVPGKHGYDGPDVHVGGRPVARGTDPQTSWDAARSVGDLTATRVLILGILRMSPRGLTDEEIWESAPPDGRTTPSGFRTRRAELVDAGSVVDSGIRRRTRAGRTTIVWRASIGGPDGDQG